jgi:uncharacterized protein YndB with AHSA1/START domain
LNLSFLKSPQGETPVIVEANFNACPERVFLAWTTPVQIKQWFGSDEGGPEIADVDLRVGGVWRFVFPESDGKIDSLAGKYVQIEESKLLEFTWTHTRRLSDGSTETSPESIVTVTFEATKNGSFSRLVHKSIQAESSRNNIGGGWCASFNKIKSLVE